MDEFAVVKAHLPLKDHLDKYLMIKTKINYADDLNFRIAVQLADTVRKFSHTGWTEMNDVVVGIKCYLRPGTKGSVWVKHSDKARTYEEQTLPKHWVFMESAEVENEVWHQFKYPLMDNFFTETRIYMSDEVTAFTLAIMNTATRVRHDASSNYFPANMYTSVGKEVKVIRYVDGEGKSLLPDAAYPENVEQLTTGPL
jgi:hypothetical protein